MDKNIRICIVGGGPAGLSAGMYLEKKGYENYTILERLDRVGGKCWSPTYNGRRYEMGAIMGVPSYYAVHDVEEFCGITHDGPKLNRNYKNKQGKVIEPFEPKKNLLKIPRLLKMKKQVKSSASFLRPSTRATTSTVTAASRKAATMASLRRAQSVNRSRVRTRTSRISASRSTSSAS